MLTPPDDVTLSHHDHPEHVPKEATQVRDARPVFEEVVSVLEGGTHAIGSKAVLLLPVDGREAAEHCHPAEEVALQEQVLLGVLLQVRQHESAEM
jgi:hypothetical protein